MGPATVIDGIYLNTSKVAETEIEIEAEIQAKQNKEKTWMLSSVGKTAEMSSDTEN